MTGGADGDLEDMRPAGERGVYVEEPPQEVSLFLAGSVLLRGWKWLVNVPVVVALVLVILILVLPPQYSSSASFTPSTSDQSTGRLSNLASQFGISVPIGTESQSPQFYADLLRTRELLRAAVTSEYRVAGASGETVAAGLTLIDKFEIGSGSERRRVAKAIRRLEDRIGVETSSETGVVTLTVTMDDPFWSEAVTTRILDLVNQFNLETRRTQARAEREFLAERVDSARAELIAAERELEEFLAQNRGYENSPRLRFEHNRLERRVSLRQQVYSSLAQSFEKAKIDEVRNTPVVTVLDPAEVPATPDRPSLLLVLIAGALGGLFIAVAWILGRHFVRQGMAHSPDDASEFRSAANEARGEIERLWKRLLNFSS